MKDCHLSRSPVKGLMETPLVSARRLLCAVSSAILVSGSGNSALGAGGV